VSVALVTGATGLVGSHIVDRLIADGWTVRALVRSPDRARDALPEAVELVAGDVLDEASFTRAAAGCHVVFHTAATIVARGGWEAYRLTNVEGTRNAIMAAERSGARLLQLSSVAVYGPSARYDAARRGERTDEDTVLGPLQDTAYYPRSKRESEAMVLDAHAQGRVWATAVRPTVIYGRRDRQFVPRIALVIKRGAFPLLRGGRSTMSIVHAANVAEGAVLAATTDIAGGRAYNLANDYDVTVRRFFELAGQALEKRPLLIPMPLSVARGALRATKWIARRAGLSIVSSSAVDFISENNPFSSERARAELGWKPSVRPEIGVPDAFRWWKESREDMKRARH
jgi:nucleoside-diphosphate-sugar epimerase